MLGLPNLSLNVDHEHNKWKAYLYPPSLIVIFFVGLKNDLICSSQTLTSNQVLRDFITSLHSIHLINLKYLFV